MASPMSRKSCLVLFPYGPSFLVHFPMDPLSYLVHTRVPFWWRMLIMCVQDTVMMRLRCVAAAAAAAAAKSLQSCPTLWNPVDGSPPGSSIPGILQARTLEWIAIPFSNAWKWKVKMKSLSRVWLFMTPWTAAYQAPLPVWFSRQEYWMEWGAIAFSENITRFFKNVKCLIKILKYWVYCTLGCW